MFVSPVVTTPSLGNLIPPGIAFLVYGAMTNTSAGRLYAAGLLPGAIMTVLFMLTIFGIALARPKLMGTKEADAPMADNPRRAPRRQHQPSVPGHLSVPGLDGGDDGNPDPLSTDSAVVAEPVLRQVER